MRSGLSADAASTFGLGDDLTGGNGPLRAFTGQKFVEGRIGRRAVDGAAIDVQVVGGQKIARFDAARSDGNLLNHLDVEIHGQGQTFDVVDKNSRIDANAAGQITGRRQLGLDANCVVRVVGKRRQVKGLRQA